LLVFLLLALVFHASIVAVDTAFGLLLWLLSLFADATPASRMPVSLVIVQPKEKDDEEEEEEEEEEDEHDGQIVDLAPPEEEERPDDADYLAEHDQTVEEETRSERFKVTPEVLSKRYSKDERYETENLLDLNMTEKSTGAMIGNDRFDPDRDGRMAALPSPWTLTNKDGVQAPTAASHADANIAGAPSNDLLNVKRSDVHALNTKEFLYAGYLNRIRRLVNMYWRQNLDNLPNSVILAKPRYTTAVEAVLDGNGTLESLVVTGESGSPELDDAVVRAFRIAGPYPNPPEGLVEKDGRAYLPHMSFTVNLGKAENNYQGIDPRAGVQFPGILKSPR